MSALPTTCPDFVEHPHRGCYSCEVAYASEMQGTTQIARALISAGVENVQVEQTGGFCMVVYIYAPDMSKALCVNAECVCFEPDSVNGGESDLIASASSIDWDIEGVSAETCAELVEIVQKNLHLIK